MAQTAVKRISSRDDTIDYTPASAVAAGDVVQIGTVPYVATQAIAASTLGSLACGGVFDVPKTTDVFTAGDAVYWNPTGNPVTGDAGTGAADNATGNYAGMAIANAANTASYVRVQWLAGKRATVVGGAVTASGITGEDSSLGITGLAGNASAGGAVAIAGGAAAAGAYDGGAVTINGGAGPTAGNTGGAVTILSGAGDGTNGTAGAVILDSSGTGATKGAITIGTNAASITLGKAPRFPVTLVNAAGSVQANAGVLVEGFNVIAAQDNTKCVILPSCVDGAWCVVVNQSTDKTLPVFPPVAKQINGAGANNAVAMAANTIDVFFSEGTNSWRGFTAAIDLA